MTDQSIVALAEVAVNGAKAALEQVRTDTSAVLIDVAGRMRTAANLIEVGEGDAAIALLRSAADGLDATFLAGVGVGQVRN